MHSLRIAYNSYRYFHKKTFWKEIFTFITEDDLGVVVEIRKVEMIGCFGYFVSTFYKVLIVNIFYTEKA